MPCTYCNGPLPNVRCPKSSGSQQNVPCIDESEWTALVAATPDPGTALLATNTPPLTGSQKAAAADRAYRWGQVDMLAWLRGEVDPDDNPMAPIAEDMDRPVSLWCLAHNLAVAGGLCAAHRLGFDDGWGRSGEGWNAEYPPDMDAGRYEAMRAKPPMCGEWQPNTAGRPVPGWEGEA